MSRFTVWLVTTIAASALWLGATEIPLWGAKPSTSTPNWPCQITFGDATGDAVRSDGGGPYVHGVSGIQCYVNRYETSGNYGNVFVNADRTSPRYLLFPGRSAVTAYTRTGYATFQNRQPGYFEITHIDTATDTNLAYRRRVRLGVGDGQFNGGLMRGDNSATDANTIGSSSAIVRPTTACSWNVTWDPNAPLEAGETNVTLPRVVALEEGGSSHTRVRTADFSMPFSAIVTVTSVKPGCGQ